MAYSDEWFGETYGIREEDLPEGGSIQNMREYSWYGMDMDRLCGNGISGLLSEFEAERELNNYLEYLGQSEE